jgi:hypothetical protein
MLRAETQRPGNESIVSKQLDSCIPLGAFEGSSPLPSSPCLRKVASWHHTENPLIGSSDNTPGREDEASSGFERVCTLTDLAAT